MAYPNLPRAPIIEGLIHMLFKPRQGANLEDLKAFAKRMSDTYPVAHELREFKAQLTIGPQDKPPQAMPVELAGFRLERQQPSFVVHAKNGELLVSRLRPYKDWGELVAETQRVLKMYADVCMPEVITRVATRFVNEIDLPVGIDFDDYLTAAPQVPAALPQIVNQFWSRVVVPDETGASVAITQVLGAFNPKTQTLPVLMDIDVYKEQELAVASDDLWTLLARMRDIKNRAFFSGLTDKAIGLFQ